MDGGRVRTQIQDNYIFYFNKIIKLKDIQRKLNFQILVRYPPTKSIVIQQEQAQAQLDRWFLFLYESYIFINLIYTINGPYPTRNLFHSFLIYFILLLNYPNKQTHSPSHLTFVFNLSSSITPIFRGFLVFFNNFFYFFKLSIMSSYYLL